MAPARETTFVERVAERLPADLRRRLLPLAQPIVRNLPGHRPHYGNLRRARPFSEHYGFDRGQPVDRHLIEGFLGRKAPLIAGDVLEIRESVYTSRFGAPGVRSHVVDIDATNSNATLVADLCVPKSLPKQAYDCAVITQTLQFLPDTEKALANLWRSLRPGASLLITVPALARIDHELPEADFWRWTPAGLRLALERSCPGAEVETEGAGNLTIALAVLYGLTVEDLRPKDLLRVEADFPVISCAVVTKPE
jgi:SAM-dependent methyltransferase